MAVQAGLAVYRRPLQQVGHIPFQVIELLLCEHAFEDVEPHAPIGAQDVGVQVALFVEADGAPVTERQRPLAALGPVANHGRFIGAVIDRRDFGEGKRGGHHAVRQKSAMETAVSRLMSGAAMGNISVPWMVPITCRQRALTPARSSLR